MVISLGWLSPATSRGLPAAQATRAGSRCLLGLAPTGGYRATPVAKRAVGSYPTVSPLPLESRAVCSLWPFPSPRGAQALPGSLPSGARTFLSTPLQPACRDHHALPPPGRKATGSGRVRASLARSLAREPPQQAAQAVLWQTPAGARPAGLLGCEPEPVTFVENQPPNARPVVRPERRRSQGYRVHEVETARALECEQIARPELRCEQEQRPVWKTEAAEQPEREPVGRWLRQPESEVEIAPLLQYPISQHRGAGGDLVLEGAVVSGQEPRVAQRRVAGRERKRVPAAARRPRADESREPATPRCVAELLAHRVAAEPAEVETERDDECVLLRGEPAEGAASLREPFRPQRRVECARGGKPFAARPPRRIPSGVARVAVVQQRDPRHARRLQPLHRVRPGTAYRVPLLPADVEGVCALGAGVAGEQVEPTGIEQRDQRIERGARSHRAPPVPGCEQRHPQYPHALLPQPLGCARGAGELPVRQEGQRHGVHAARGSHGRRHELDGSGRLSQRERHAARCRRDVRPLGGAAGPAGERVEELARPLQGVELLYGSR